MERATTAQNGTRESRKSRQMTTMAITQLLSLESSSFWSELLHDDLNIAKNNWVIDMQKMSFSLKSSLLLIHRQIGAELYFEVYMWPRDFFFEKKLLVDNESSS